MRHISLLLTFALFYSTIYSQPPNYDVTRFSLTVLTEKSEPAAGAVVELRKDDKLVKVAVADANGIASFEKIDSGNYTFSISHTGYKKSTSSTYHFPSVNAATIALELSAIILQDVSVVSRKPFIQQQAGKIILNVEASPTNAGSTVLEVLEKSPGVTVDRNGSIALHGKTGVLVLIDDKPTYLSGADLNNLLSSMSSSQVERIELMTNPPAKYDASGNAGIINIVTKKNRQKGFNGSFTISASQGIYPKNNNSVALNFRSGKINTFLNYNINLVKYLTDIYALRKYYDANGTITHVLDQPSYFSGKFINQIVKTGLDYSISRNTTIGFTIGGIITDRRGHNIATATWLDPISGSIDSTISTVNNNKSHFFNQSANINARHTISSKQDISADIDWLRYNIRTEQLFNNHFLGTGGYVEASQGNIPTTITIKSGKIDHNLKLGKDATLQSGWKSSSVNTDNTATYQNFNGTVWSDDLGKSNHFLYKEDIHAVYSSFQNKSDRWSMQAGLRYEYTNYKAHQLGNSQQKDSSFSRSYDGLFPGGYVSYKMDSLNSFTFTMSRRIDRPAFQTLNPFYFIVNKYTYSTGNPFIRPQDSWNLELNHQFKSLFSTTVSYSIIKNYFSQIFLNDTAKGILLYTQGNVGRTVNLGLSSTLTASPFKWWSITAQVNFNHKVLKGINGNSYTSDINQLNFNVNNQLTIAKTYTAEVSGFYTTRARNDIQELLYPTGQLSFGVSRPILKKKATLRLSARDIFYTNAMEGLTQFPNATEYFKLRRDSRVVTLSFTYRFGKAYKASKRSGGGANDEMQRVGSGG